MTRPITFSAGEFYHIYNRGTDKRKIFSNSRDYERFLALMYLSNSTYPIHIRKEKSSLHELLKSDRGKVLVDIGAYCLMPNRFHILIHERADNGISRFMQKLTTAYTMYFNKKNDRSGNLFQGVFKAKHADQDKYLQYLFSYIHLNPVVMIQSDWEETGIKNIKEAKKFLDSFHYSSYKDYTNFSREEGIILNKGALPDYFEKTEDFKSMLDFWLNYKKEE